MSNDISINENIGDVPIFSANELLDFLEWLNWHEGYELDESYYYDLWVFYSKNAISGNTNE